MQIDLHEVAVTYPGGIPGLWKTSAHFSGQVIGILGHNGSGKSTLIRVLAGNQPPTQGEVAIDGRPVARPDPLPRRGAFALSYFPQELPTFPVSQTPFQTIENSLLLGRATDPAGRREMADSILVLVGLQDVRDRAVATFSGGMKQKVRIAQALVHNPAVLILDEPTTGLDVEERLMILRLLARLSRRMPIVFSTHDCSDAAAICEIVVVLAGARMVATGSPESLTQTVDGRVWEWQLPSLDTLGDDGMCVTRVHRIADGIKVRAVGPAPPRGAVSVAPTLEDAYAYLTREARDGFGGW